MKLSLAFLVLLIPVVASGAPKKKPGPKKRAPVEKKALPQEKRATPEALFHEWYDVVQDGQKVGFLEEQAQLDAKEGIIQYSSTVRRLENGMPVEERIASLSRNDNLMPLSFAFEKRTLEGKTALLGETSTAAPATMAIPSLKKNLVMPAGTVFAGLFAVLVQRQGELKDNVGYASHFLYEDTGDLRDGAFTIRSKDKVKQKVILKVVSGDTWFNATFDSAGVLETTESSDQRLLMVRTTSRADRAKWDSNALFEKLPK